MLTKRTYSALVLVLLVAFPAVALAADRGAPSSAEPARPHVGLAAGAVVATPLIEPATSLRREMRAAAKRMEAERKARQRRERRQLYATLPGGVSMSTLEAIAACESGGDPTIVSSDGSYRGKYQFSFETWASVGGSGDPAATPEQEQDYRAALLYAAAGSSPWPICG